MLAVPLTGQQTYHPSLANPISEPWRWTAISGLKDKGAQCIAQDKNQLIWFGTAEGLASYDGYEWNKYGFPDNLKGDAIRSITEKQGGGMYIGTTAGLYEFTADKQWFPIFPNRPGLPVVVNDIINLDDGSILVAIGEYRSNVPICGLLHLKNQEMHFYVSQATRDLLDQHPPIQSCTYKVVHDSWTIAAQGENAIFKVLALHKGRSGLIYVGVSDLNKSSKLLVFQTSKDMFNDLSIYQAFTSADGFIARDNLDIIETDQGEIWVVCSAHELGLSIYDGTKWQMNLLSDQFGGVNSQSSIFQSSDGTIWVDGHGRIFSYYENRWQEYQYPAIPISTSSPYTFFESTAQQLWILGKQSDVFRFDNTFNNWITYENLNYQCESADGQTWYISADGKVVKNRFGHWESYGVQEGLMDTPVSLYQTSYRELWAVGSHEQTAATAYFDGSRWTRTLHPLLSWGIDYRAFYESNTGDLWFGGSVNYRPDRGHQGGVLRLKNPQENKTDWVHYPKTIEEGFNNCYGIGESKDGRLWFGGRPLWSFDGTSWQIEDTLPQFKAHIDQVKVDSEGVLWLGSRHFGILSFDGVDWQKYTTKHGLPSNQIVSLSTNSRNELWALTYGGIARFDGNTWSSGIFPSQVANNPKQVIIKHGNANQLWFNHSTIDWRRRSLTTLLNASVENYHFRAIGYKPDHYEPKTRIVSYTQRVGQSRSNSIFWEGNDYFENTKNLEYSWRINEEGWSEYSTQNYCQLKAMESGTYRFEVRARDRDFNVDTEPAKIEFVVLAPWWQRPQFVLLSLAAIFTITFLQFRVWKHYQRLQTLNTDLAEQSSLLAEKNQQIETQRNRLKKTVKEIRTLSESRLQFFTNVSHEFRTPLSLIIGSLDELRHQEKPNSGSIKKYYDIIARNANRIFRLVNQILEIYKVEESTLQFKPTLGDFVTQVKEIVELFGNVARQRNIQLSVHPEIDTLPIYYDQDKLEKILFNLLSNAFKNVSPFGKISVYINLTENTLSHQKVQLIVEDNGKGIPKDHLDKIFERFYHVNTEMDEQFHVGIGIGLSYIKELVKIHQGNIQVSSDPGIATTFTITLPFEPQKHTLPVAKGLAEGKFLSPMIRQAVAGLENVLQENLPLEDDATQDKTFSKNGTRLLIVDDDSDTRQFLRNCLGETYAVTVAANGLEALRIANSEDIDLIISDVMMPQMDGFQLCSRIKSDFITSHIPIILLTAKTRDEDKIRGFETGADAYVAKPFSRQILLSRVNSLIRSRDRLKAHFQKKIELSSEEMTIAAVDETFIQAAIQVVENQLDDTSLDAERLARTLGVSRIQLYRKTRALTGQTVNQFIRSIRLKKAAELLRSQKLTVAEVAYQTGFSAPNHFSTYFRKHFGKSPSAYIKDTMLD